MSSHNRLQSKTTSQQQDEQGILAVFSNVGSTILQGMLWSCMAFMQAKYLNSFLTRESLDIQQYKACLVRFKSSCDWDKQKAGTIDDVSKNQSSQIFLMPSNTLVATGFKTPESIQHMPSSWQMYQTFLSRYSLRNQKRVKTLLPWLYASERTLHGWWSPKSKTYENISRVVTVSTRKHSYSAHHAKHTRRDINCLVLGKVYTAPLR